jgi:hypothetical protein
LRPLYTVAVDVVDTSRTLPDFRLSLTLISRIDLRRGGESLLIEILGYPRNAEVAPAMRGLIIAVVVIVVIAVVAYFLLSRRRRP